MLFHELIALGKKTVLKSGGLASYFAKSFTSIQKSTVWRQFISELVNPKIIIIHACMHPCILAWIHPCMLPCSRAHMHTCSHASIHAYIFFFITAYFTAIALNIMNKLNIQYKRITKYIQALAREGCVCG